MAAAENILDRTAANPRQSHIPSADEMPATPSDPTKDSADASTRMKRKGKEAKIDLIEKDSENSRIR